MGADGIMSLERSGVYDPLLVLSQSLAISRISFSGKADSGSSLKSYYPRHHHTTENLNRRTCICTTLAVSFAARQPRIFHVDAVSARTTHTFRRALIRDLSK